MCPGILAIVFIIAEIINLNKAARMTTADFPNVTPEQLETKRTQMRQSAWWLIGGALFMSIVGNILLVAAAAAKSEPMQYVAYGVGIAGFLISIVISAIHGSKAAKIK